MWMLEERRSIKDRRVIELGPPLGMQDRRIHAERRLPLVTEYELTEHESRAGIVIDYGVPVFDLANSN